MNIVFRKLDIKHPEWLKHSNPQKCITMHIKGQLPESIAGWMIVVGLKHPLRAIYGSDLAAAWDLLLDAIYERWRMRVLEPLRREWGYLMFQYARLYAWLFYVCGGRGGGRHSDPDAIRCEFGWGGMRRWAVHTYGDDGTGEDVEPVDECPDCGEEI